MAMENPRTERRFLARKIIDRWFIFQHAMFDYRRVLFPQNLPCPAWDRLNAIAALAAAVTLMERRAFLDLASGILEELYGLPSGND